MNLLRRTMRTVARAVAKRSLKYAGVPLRDPALVAMFGMRGSSAGVNVTEETALNFSAVYSAVNLISSTSALLPFNLYDNKPKQGEESVVEHHIANFLLSKHPNDYCTPFVFKQTQQAHALLWGNSYTEIIREGSIPVALRILLPSNVQPDLDDDNGDKIYHVTDPRPGEEPMRIIKDANMLHIPGLSYDGLAGSSVVGHARESIGLGIAAETFGATFFGNGAIPQGVITHPGDLSPEAEKKLAEDFEKKHRGPDNANRVAVLDEGMKYTHVGIPPEDAQFLQSRQFQVVEIARWFRVPPHLLYDMTQATFGNYEQSGMDFLTFTLLPWLTKWEQECKAKLLTEKEQERYYFGHNPDVLLLPDLKTRYEAYATGRNNGWLTLNDILRRERMPLEKPEIGDIRVTASTMKTMGSADPTAPIEVSTIESIFALIDSQKPIKEKDAVSLIKLAMPTAHEDFTKSIIEICKGKGSVK